MKKLKFRIYQLLNSSSIGRSVINQWFKNKFSDSATYWEKRYETNGTSGNGSYGELAEYKATVLNSFVEDNNINAIIEFGCGDGNQLGKFKFPNYLGLDVSATAIEKCRTIFKNDATKAFAVYKGNENYEPENKNIELALSLDVIYHLIEDEVFENYMWNLFRASKKFVIIYAWDTQQNKSFHVKHRRFTNWIDSNMAEWELKNKIGGGHVAGACDFFIFKRK